MSSASAAEGTPESRRLLEDIQNMVQANILLERKVLRHFERPSSAVSL